MVIAGRVRSGLWGLAVVILPLGAGGPALAEHEDREPCRGIYASAGVAGATGFLDLADSLVAAGGNTIVFDIKDQPGELSYLSRVPLAIEIGASRRASIADPAGLVAQLETRGIYTVARISCFYDRHLAAARPDLVPHTRGAVALWRERGRLAWLDPSLPEVQQYILDLVLEVAAFGVDEIQLDYVRFPTAGRVDEAVFAFDERESSKREIITEFVGRVRQILTGTEVRLSADLFGVVAWKRKADINRTGQDLAALLPYLDVVSPMLYPSHFYPGFDDVVNPAEHPYYFVNQGCERLRQLAAAHGVEVRPWLQAFPYRVPNIDRTYLTEQIAAAVDGGARGWLLWQSSADYGLALEAISHYQRGPHPRGAPAGRAPIRVTEMVPQAAQLETSTVD